MGRKILYLDDEAECLNIFRKTFDKDYDVRTAQTVVQARRLLIEQPADIIICDQNMPDIKGLKFLAEVAKSYPSSYRVLLTGTMVVGEAIHEIGAGAIHLFIPKPWTEERVRQALERAKLYLDLRNKAA